MRRVRSPSLLNPRGRLRPRAQGSSHRARGPVGLPAQAQPFVRQLHCPQPTSQGSSLRSLCNAPAPAVTPHLP